MNNTITLIQAIIGFILLGAGIVLGLWKFLSGFTTKLESQIQDVKDGVNHTNLEITKISTALWGIDGQNGLRGDVREIRDDVKNLRERVTDLEAVG